MKTETADLVSSDVETPFLANSVQAAPQQHARKKPLTLLPLIALIFFEVSGGPFGTEDAVAAGGPLLVLAGLLIFPLLWSVPEALITAELATAFPENSGYVAWVTAAFGPFWGFQEGFWSWLSGVTDNSIYPVMFADNLRIFVPALNQGWPRWVGGLEVTVATAWVFSLQHAARQGAGRVMCALGSAWRQRHARCCLVFVKLSHNTGIVGMLVQLLNA
eukprot:GHRQ01017944.1.p1 GENE.GHRQ01017944.1~~GHRQ01017944.1.p1  ORF type:complete len:218 (+),score=40.76 GHRQ01017944.1:249-902(+)